MSKTYCVGHDRFGCITEKRCECGHVYEAHIGNEGDGFSTYGCSVGDCDCTGSH